MSNIEANQNAHLARLKAAQATAAEKAAQEQTESQAEAEAEAGAGVAPLQVQPAEVDVGEIERLKAEIESLKAAQSGGNAVVDVDEVKAIPDERLERYREVLGDDVTELLAEDLMATRRDALAKVKEAESKLQKSERYNGFMSKVDAQTLKAFNSAEFQQFAKTKKLGRKLTLADELNEINADNDIEGAAYLSEQVQAWQQTQKITRKASRPAGASVDRFVAAGNSVTQDDLNLLVKDLKRQTPGTPAFEKAKQAYYDAKLQFTEGLIS